MPAAASSVEFASTVMPFTAEAALEAAVWQAVTTESFADRMVRVRAGMMLFRELSVVVNGLDVVVVFKQVDEVL